MGLAFTTFLARVHGALGSFAFARLARRMAADPEGRRILAERPRIYVGRFAIADLEALPPSTLGGAWYRHLRDNDFIADVPVPPAPLPEAADTAFWKARWRETHDFRHVLTGLSASTPDEVTLAAFQFAQVPNLFSALVVLLGPIYGWRERNPLRTWSAQPRAFLAGWRCPPRARVYWEELLDRPLDEVRTQLQCPILA